MITARRIRERQAADQAGLPDPEPPRPSSLSIDEHDRIVYDMRRAHAAELAALKAELERLKAQGRFPVMPLDPQVETVQSRPGQKTDQDHKRGKRG